MWSRISLLLPPTSQRIVELDESQSFVKFCLRQAQLGIEIAGIAVQDFEVTRDPTLVTNIREPRGILRRCTEQLLLCPEFLILTVCDQRVRNFAEGLLDRLLVDENGFLFLCFRQPHVGADFSGGENGLSQLTTKTPQTSWASEQVRESRTLVAARDR